MSPKVISVFFYACVVGVFVNFFALSVVCSLPNQIDKAPFVIGLLGFSVGGLSNFLRLPKALDRRPKV